MLFKSITGTTLALGSVASAAPTVLIKRDMCSMIGNHVVEIVVGSGGPGQAPISYTYSTLHIEYVGGVAISDIDEVSISSKHKTFNPDKTRLPNPITWWANFSLGFKDCHVEYNGQTYQGQPTSTGKQPLGTTAWQCRVDFPCEGGISGL